MSNGLRTASRPGNEAAQRSGDQILSLSERRRNRQLKFLANMQFYHSSDPMVTAIHADGQDTGTETGTDAPRPDSRLRQGGGHRPVGFRDFALPGLVDTLFRPLQAFVVENRSPISLADCDCRFHLSCVRCSVLGGEWSCCARSGSRTRISVHSIQRDAATTTAGWLARISHQVASEGVEMVGLALAAQARDDFARRTRVRARRRT